MYARDGGARPRVAIAGPSPHVRGDCRADPGAGVQHPRRRAVDGGSALLAAARPGRPGPALHVADPDRGRPLLASESSRIPAVARCGRGCLHSRDLRAVRLHTRCRRPPDACERRPGVRRLLHGAGGAAVAGQNVFDTFTDRDDVPAGALGALTGRCPRPLRRAGTGRTDRRCRFRGPESRPGRRRARRSETRERPTPA